MLPIFMTKQARLLITSSIFCFANIVLAEQATLSDNLTLQIPTLQFQGQNLWVEFQYNESITDSINFTLTDYGLLAAESVPPKILDIATVTDGSAPTIVDIKHNEARLTFISTIPLACSVIYGSTPTFGAIATDPNMNGGAIVNHNPILTQLAANTLYYYRVQGSDVQGNLYWAPTASFTTTAAAMDNNLLSLNNGASVTAVSSNFGGATNNQAWGANSAIDGSNNSAWSSAGDGDNAFIEISLAQSKQINTIEVWSRSMSDGTAKIFSFTIMVDSGEVLGPFTLPDTQEAHQFTINRNSSSIRLDVASSSGGNTGLVEIAAY
ncbi:MAG: hypothetical protein methR_P1506 [Methyloprofundus sp.]|nr:MAG: hypothetical protein methR_P1506 [Methyloprofundus sp.]